MSKVEKLLSKLLKCPVPMDFRWEELEKVLFSLGYEKKLEEKQVVVVELFLTKVVGIL